MEKKLSLRNVMVVGLTLFGLFFGAGNLIFPVHLGQLAGRNVLSATLGFIITGVTIPILAVAAIGLTHSDGLQDLCTKKVGKRFGYVFTCLLYLTIGPCFAIPRCGNTTFTTGVYPLLGGADEKTALLIFSLIFFALVLFFSLRPNEIMTWVGKVITPFFLLLLGVLIFASFLNPGIAVSAVDPAEGYESGTLFSGILEGYNTMDAIAGLAFGIIIVDCIRKLGVTDDSRVGIETIRAGVFTALLMGLIYLLTTVSGTFSRGLFETSENGGVALAQIAEHYLGLTGSVLLAFTIGFACLKTAIGLVTSCAETFVRMFPNGPVYRVWAILITAASFIISNVGLTELISYSVPVLMLLYPLAIVLILLSLVSRAIRSRFVFIGALCGAFSAAFFDFLRTLPFDLDISFAAKLFPFMEQGFGWVIPALIGLLIGIVLAKMYPERNLCA